MERTFAEILWQLERNLRKYCYCWSCGTQRTTATTFLGIVKAVTFVLCLCLVYFTICFILLEDTSSTKLDFPDEVEMDGGSYEDDNRSPISGHYQDGFRNISNSILNTLNGRGSDMNVSHVNKLTLIFHKLVHILSTALFIHFVIVKIMLQCCSQLGLT